MGSHSVTCHPTQVNAPRLNSIYLPRGMEGWVGQCTSREWNSRALDHESDAITTTPPSHHYRAISIRFKLATLTYKGDLTLHVTSSTDQQSPHAHPSLRTSVPRLHNLAFNSWAFHVSALKSWNSQPITATFHIHTPLTHFFQSAYPTPSAAKCLCSY